MTTNDVMLLVADALNGKKILAIENWCRQHGSPARLQEIRREVEGEP